MIEEHGPWEVQTCPSDTPNEYKVVIQSDDFTHDVMLIVDGDFRDFEQKREYATEIAKRLNSWKEI